MDGMWHLAGAFQFKRLITSLKVTQLISIYRQVVDAGTLALNLQLSLHPFHSLMKEQCKPGG